MRTNNWCFSDSFWENRVASTWGEKFKDWQMSCQSRVSFKQQGIRKGSLLMWMVFISSIILKHNYFFLNEIISLTLVASLNFDVQSYSKNWNYDFFDFNWLEATNGGRWLAKIRKPLINWDRKKSENRLCHGTEGVVSFSS